MCRCVLSAMSKQGILSAFTTRISCKNDVSSLAGVGVLSSPGEEGAISFASNQVEPVTAVPSSTCTHVPHLPVWPHEHSHRPSLVSCSVNGCSCWADSWVATKHHEPPAVATTMPAGESTRGSARPCGCARSCSAWLVAHVRARTIRHNQCASKPILSFSHARECGKLWACASYFLPCHTGVEQHVVVRLPRAATRCNELPVQLDETDHGWREYARDERRARCAGSSFFPAACRSPHW